MQSSGRSGDVFLLLQRGVRDMLNNVRFVGDERFPVLYESDPFRVQVKLPQKKAADRNVKTQVRVNDNGELEFGACLVKDADKSEMILGVEAGPHLVNAYRALLLLRDVPVLDRANMLDVGECAINRADGDAKKRAGTGYDDVMNAVPPNLHEAVMLLVRMDLAIPPDVLAPMLDDGRLTLTDDLRDAGYETTEMNKQRGVRTAVLLQPFEPLLAKFPGAPECPHHHGQSPLRDRLLYVLTRGVTDDTVLAGAWAVYRLYVDHYREEEERIGRVTSAVGRLLGGYVSSRTKRLDRRFAERNDAMKRAAAAAMELRATDDHRGATDIIAEVERLILQLPWRAVTKI